MGRTGFHRKGKHGGGGERGLRFLPGLIVAGIVAVVLISTAAYLMMQCVVPVRGAALLGKLCFALASIVGCWWAARSSRTGKLLAAAITGVLLLALTAASTAAGKGTGDLRLLTPCAISLGTVLLGAMLGARRRGGGYR